MSNARNIGQTFHLRFTLHEDEAQKTGMAFKPLDADTVLVWTTFRGYPENEKASEQTLSTQEAREMYRKLIDEPHPWPEDGFDKVWVPVVRKEEPAPSHGPEPGTYAYTARLMAGPNPSAEEGEFWDRWKDEMKEGRGY